VIETTTSATRALDLLKTVSFDAIISDYQMPGIDGIEFLRTIRSRYGDLPFVLFTGRGREDVVIDAINNGADFYLQKGGDPGAQFAELAHKIRQAILRKKAERGLRLNEARLQRAETVARFGNWEIYLDSKTVTASVGARNIYGLGDRNLSLSDIQEVPLPEYRSLLNTALEELIDKGEPYNVEFKIRRLKDGKLLDIHSLAEFDPGRNMVFGVIHDITERKKAEESLKKSERDYREVIENIQDCLYRSDLNDCLIFASPSLASLLGYRSTEEMYGADIAQTFYKDPEERRKFFQEITPSGFVSNYQVTLKKADGSIIDVETNSHYYYGDDGKIAGIEGILRDVTARNIAQKAIRESEQKYRDLVEHSTDIIYTLDFRGVITSISPALTPLLGYLPEEVIGKNLREYITPASLEIAIREMYRKEENEIAASRYEIGIRSKDGKIIPYEINSRTRYRDGKPFDILGIARDITDSRRKEDNLSESEAKFRSLVETSPDMIWEIDSNATFTYLSPQSVDILGFSPDEVIGKTFFSLIPPEFIPKIREIFLLHMQNGERINVLEVPAYHHDGTVHYIEIRSAPVRNESGLITGFRGIAHDISNRKRASEALMESEERFRTLIEQMQDAVVIVAFDGTILFANPSTFRMVGMKPGDLPPGTNISQFLDPCSQEKVFLDLKAISEGELPYIAEYQLKTPDGEPRWIVAEGLRISYLGTWADLVTMHDITDAKQAEKELRESEEKIRDLIVNTPDIVWQTDELSRFLYVSPQVEAILGYPPEYLIGRTPFDMISPEGIAANREIFHRAARAGGKIVIFTTPWAHRDGHTVELESHARPVFHTDGTFAGFRGIDRDVTERRKSENALRQANRQLNLLTGITRHDILNKVTVILGHLAIARKKSTNPDMGAIIEKLEGATKSIRSQIEFTRVYQDLGTHEPQWQDLGRVMQLLNVPETVRFDIFVDGIEVFADPMLEKVFSNLLDNSIRHGQHVTGVRVSYSKSEGGMTIIWEDNGIGIAEDEKEKIFERGFGKNTGFGLFLVSEILCISGITIRETGNEGRGARFEIRIPEGGYRVPAGNREG
jgi:PAS domain S-box-containing protein